PRAREPRRRPRRDRGRRHEHAEVEGAHVAGAPPSHRSADGRPAGCPPLRARAPRRPAPPPLARGAPRVPRSRRLATAPVPAARARELDGGGPLPPGALKRGAGRACRSPPPRARLQSMASRNAPLGDDGLQSITMFGPRWKKGGTSGLGAGSPGRRRPQFAHSTFVHAGVPPSMALIQLTIVGTPPVVSV